MSQVSPDALIAKAERALESARLPQNAGDIDGACNRAYYAMFDAAKAALLIKAPSSDPTTGKTHSGMIAAFGLHLVKSGLVPVELGRAFNRAQNIRQVADYTGDLIAPGDVGWLVQQADGFVRVLKELCQSASLCQFIIRPSLPKRRTRSKRLALTFLAPHHPPALAPLQRVC